MVLHEFPDIVWLKNEIKSGFTQNKEHNKTQGWPNVVLNTKTKHTYRDGIKGPFSLFLNIVGNSIVTVDNHRRTVDEDTFFVTNQDQIYNLEIDAVKSVETFNIHFGEMFTNEVLESIVRSPEHLLENEFQAGPAVCFYNATYYRDKQFNAITQQLYDSAKENKATNLREEELLYSLFVYLYDSNQKNKIKFAKLPVIKSTTRKEIEKRLMGAVDYIHAYFKKDISLGQLHEVACLSKFHFLRLFKIAFGYSPYQYIMFLRLQKGLTQLKTTSKTVQQIAVEIGLENANSLSRMVYKKTGHYPSYFRK